MSIKILIKLLIAFDDMITDIVSNKKLNQSNSN